ncbi:MAG: hypothetical protein ACRDM7_08235 [Thermoleophilaceae bacterium]
MDPNMRIAMFLGHALTLSPLELPSALQLIDGRAEFIVRIDDGLLVDGEGGLLVDRAGVPQWEAMGKRLPQIADVAAPTMPGVDPLSQVSTALRLWAGCLDAAKAVANETRSGPNTEATRAQAFQHIDAQAASDALYCAGVEAAPAFRQRRGHPYYLDGVPNDSPVRRHVTGGGEAPSQTPPPS